MTKYPTRQQLLAIRSIVDAIGDARAINGSMINLLKGQRLGNQAVAGLIDVYRQQRDELMLEARKALAELMQGLVRRGSIKGVAVTVESKTHADYSDLIRPESEPLPTTDGLPKRWGNPIEAWNTGRMYSEKGQRIASRAVAALGDKAVVAMVDIDRGLDYMLSVDFPFGEAEVMRAYDRNDTLRHMWMDAGLKAELAAAALNVPGVQP